MQFTLGMPFLGVLGKFYRNRKGLKYICSKFIHGLQLTHWRVKSEHLLASGL